MSIYTYPQSKVIDEVTFRKTGKDAVRAYLHARPGVDSDTIQNIMQALQRTDCECIPYDLDGKPTLEVRGFSYDSVLLKTLADWTSGSHQVSEEKVDKIGLIDKIRKRSLQATGVTYLIGDAGLLKYGQKEKDPLLKAGAFSYFLGTLSLLFYGRNDQSDLQVRDLAGDMERFLADNNIKMSEGSALREITKDKNKNILQQLDEFAKRYPSEIFNTVTALAGVFIATSAYKNKIRFKPPAHMDAKAIRTMRQEGWMDLGLGTLTATSGTFATVVKEKKPDPNDPPAKGLGWLWQKIREHPLAVAAVGYTVATMCHAGSTWKAYWEAKRVGDKARQESVPNRALFVAMAFLSEFLLAISSKGHGEGVVSDTSVDSSAIALAADLIAMQPKEKRQQLLDSMAKFLGKPEVLAMDDQEVAQLLRTQVEAVRKNPWAMVQQAKMEKSMPVVRAEKPDMAAWQAKIALQETATPVAQLST